MNYISQMHYVSQKFVFQDRLQNINGLLELKTKQTRFEELQRPSGFPGLQRALKVALGFLELFGCYKKHSGNCSHYKSGGGGAGGWTYYNSSVTQADIHMRRPLTTAPSPSPTTLLTPSVPLYLPPCCSSSILNTPAQDLHPCWSLCLEQAPKWLIHSPTSFRSLPRRLPLKEAIHPWLPHLKWASQPLSPASLYFLPSVTTLKSSHAFVFGLLLPGTGTLIVWFTTVSQALR